MNIVLRAGRGYWRLNEIVWQHIRRAEMPLLAVIGAASVVLYFVGLETGKAALLWACPAFTASLLAGSLLARRP